MMSQTPDHPGLIPTPPPHRARCAACLAVAGLLLAGCSVRPPAGSPLLLAPSSEEMSRQAPALYGVRLQTTKGDILIEVHRDWAPHGADRFYNLIRAGYYDQSKFFRVIAGKWAQFGINGDPEIATLWRTLQGQPA